MPGTIVIKPLKADFENDLKIELAEGVKPYCVATMGDKTIKGPTCQKSGKHPFWKGTFHFPVHDEKYCFIEIKNNQIASHEVIGVSEIDIKEVNKEGKLTKWYDVYFKKKRAGKILIETSIEDEELPMQFLEFDGKDGHEISIIQSSEDHVLKESEIQGLSTFNLKDEKLDDSTEEEIIEKFAGLDGDDEATKEDLGESLPLPVDEDLVDQNIVVTKESGALNATVI